MNKKKNYIRKTWINNNIINQDPQHKHFIKYREKSDYYCYYDDDDVCWWCFWWEAVLKIFQRTKTKPIKETEREFDYLLLKSTHTNNSLHTIRYETHLTGNDIIKTHIQLSSSSSLSYVVCCFPFVCCAPFKEFGYSNFWSFNTLF